MRKSKWGRIALIVVLVIAIHFAERSGHWVTAACLGLVLVFGLLINIDITVNHHTDPDL